MLSSTVTERRTVLEPATRDALAKPHSSGHEH